MGRSVPSDRVESKFTAHNQDQVLFDILRVVLSEISNDPIDTVTTIGRRENNPVLRSNVLQQLYYSEMPSSPS